MAVRDAPVLHKGIAVLLYLYPRVTDGTLAPLWEVGIRILNYLEHDPRARTVAQSQGFGAAAPVGASGQLGNSKFSLVQRNSKTLCCCEERIVGFGG